MAPASEDTNPYRPLREASEPSRPYVECFVVGAFILFLELVLVRWLATEIRVFAYFKNFTLIACFLGMGLGCIVESRRLGFVWTYPLLAVLVGTILVPDLLGVPLFQTVNRFLAELTDMPLWSWGRQTTSFLGRLAALTLMVVIFLFLAAVFAPAGQLLGTRMNACRRKFVAYSVNIAGSLAGIAGFEIVSYLSLPPVAWFLAAALCGAFLVRGRSAVYLGLVSTALITALFVLQPSHGVETVWSPYQKVTYQPIRIPTRDGKELFVGYGLNVNETFHQKAVNLDTAFLRAQPDLFPEAAGIEWLSYNLAYRFQERPANVLVVGAGTGNDVAAALRNGAAHVDAVEIDPGIVAIGRKVHPEHPYDNPRVTVIVDDARSFLKKTHRTYDLIVFGALDSHTINSALSNLRIDNYVYTVEAFREARSRLAPQGIVWLVFTFERAYIGERIYAMLAEAFGAPPVLFKNDDVHLLSPAGGGATFVIDREGRIEERIKASPALAAIVSMTRMAPRGEVLLATDDWPYLYVRDRAIPNLYLIVVGVMVVAAAIVVRPLVGHIRRLDPHYFLLGAAFLLLEVQSISRLALVFGNTWEVNAIVMSSVLLMILAANVAASRLPSRFLPLVYLGLAVSLLVSYATPLDALLSFGPVAKLFAAGVVTAMPILFAGVVFVRTFAGADRSNVALGSNLLGAIVGGACESASFVVGLNALVLLALLFYAGSFLVLFLTGRVRLFGTTDGE